MHRLSQLGTAGVYPNNTERDFHTMLSTMSRRFGVPIETVKARMYDHKEARVTWQHIHVIQPDSMAAALFNKGDRIWRKAMFGQHTEEQVAKFWKHCQQNCEWFKTNSCCTYPALSRLVPMSFYGDDIAAWKGSECGAITILGWSSDLAYGNDSWTRYWPIAIYTEYSSTPWTYDDIMSSVIPRVKAMVDPGALLFDWSDSGYAFCFSSLQGDLKWVKSQYHLFNYQTNNICSNCGVQKTHPNVAMTLANFEEDAPYCSVPPSLSEFHANRTTAY